MRRSRRQLLAALAAGGGLLAGCAAREPDDATAGGAPAETPGSPPSSADTDASDRPTATPRSPEPLPVAGGWPQYGANAGHTGVSTSSGVPDDGRAYWHLRRVRSGPAVLADGRLVHYAKLGADPDAPVTKTRTREPDAGTAHPVYGDPYVVVRDASDGRIQWSKPLDGPGAGWPAVAGGRAVAAVNGQITAYDAATGAVEWSKDHSERVVGDPTVTGDALVVPLQGTVHGDATLQEPQVQCYDLTDGRPRWSADPPKRANRVAVANDTVVVVSAGWDGTGVVLSHSLARGTERWRARVPGDSFEGPVVAAGRVYLASSDGVLHALSVDDGETRWTREFERRPAGVAADDDAVYVGAGGRFAALAAEDGSVRWSREELPGAVAPPAVGDGVVYVGTAGESARLYALDAVDGTERWASAPFPFQTVEGDMMMAGVESQPALGDGAVYVSAADGLYAFGPRSDRKEE
ncbi:PQQ-binding-like beta-propeller repeat protein [Salinigranum sp.]|uniref:outer membrane protein assembly factor BamB family protein n=1 Tax=Salinigranum sp. TaxID=1966351 RepID=UPI00356AA280